MKTIEKIRQKIEELYDGEAPKHDQQCDFSDGYFTGLSVISNFLDTLSEDPELVRHPPIAYTYPSDASRDERLKMALLALLNSDLIKVAGNKFTKQDLIDWVEKRQEQKPAEWSKEDEDMLVSVLHFLNTNRINERGKVITWVNSLPKRFNLQPKQEWSEEDEKDMAHIIRILDDCYAYGKHDLSKTDHENLVNKLKSLRPSWKPSEEQSMKED